MDDFTAPYFYEQLGATCLLFHNTEQHACHDASTAAPSNIGQTSQVRSGVQARCHDPMGNDIVHPEMPKLPEDLAVTKPGSKRRQPPTNLEQRDGSKRNGAPSTYTQSKEQPKEITETKAQNGESSSEKNVDILLPLQQEALAQMLLDDIDDEVRRPASLDPPSSDAPLEDACADTVEEVKADNKRRQRFYYTPGNDTNGPNPHRSGNTLVTIPCRCVACQSRNTSPSWYLLHPTGSLMNRIRLSRVLFPRDVTSSNARISELDVGDTVLQLVKCGTDSLIARTTRRCVVCQVRSVAPLQEENGICSGMELDKVLHQIDLRSSTLFQRSFRPVDVSCHPKYGTTAWTDPNIAILCEYKRERNTIYHVLAGPVLHSNEHVISNLQDISKIDFSAQHPMVLWSVARSYVRPQLAGNHLYKYPRSGQGHSLYSIDLRSNLGSFQWSPSAAEFAAEGTFSLSGIWTDWVDVNSLWVASTSAGKTWQLDARMPCQVVNTWSLPHKCDDVDVTLPPYGLAGAGTLFCQPTETTTSSKMSMPMLSVQVNPGSFGIHCYQKPRQKPRFETGNLECAACPGLARLVRFGVACSSVFPLPDVSDRVFTCGLAAIRAPTSHFLDKGHLAKMGYAKHDVSGVLCAFSMTCRGDLYAHAMMQSIMGCQTRQICDGQHLGCHTVVVPGELERSVDTSVDSGALQLTLSGRNPMLSSSIAPESSYGSQASEAGDIASCGPGNVRRSFSNPIVLQNAQFPLLANQLGTEIRAQLRSFPLPSSSQVADDAVEQAKSDVTTTFLGRAAANWPMYTVASAPKDNFYDIS